VWTVGGVSDPLVVELVVTANSEIVVNASADIFIGPAWDDAVERVHRSGWVERAAEIVVVAALAGELVAMFGNVISRSLFDTSLRCCGVLRSANSR
jgi:hypothetical protein